MLVLTVFILTALSLISVSFWSLVRYKTITLGLKRGNLKAKLAARSGLEDVLYELKQGHAFSEVNPSVSTEWKHVAGQTFYKHPNFEYPVTMTVTVVGDPKIETVNVTSKSDISLSSISRSNFSAQLQAQIVRSITDELYILSMEAR